MPDQNDCMTAQTLKKSGEFIQALEVEKETILQSTTLTQHEKNDSCRYNEERKHMHNRLLATGQLNSQTLRYLIEDLLIRWNESIGIDTEIFWNKMYERGIKFPRKEPLRWALQKGRFRNVHQGMEAAKHFDSLIKSKHLEPNFSYEELSELRNIIDRDTNSRLELFKSCLKKGRLTASVYLRFGESVAYFNECDLWEKFFTVNEVNQLTAIWKSFKL